MENIVIVHGYAHRLRRDGMIESAPVDKNRIGEFVLRMGNEMDLTGADLSEVKIMLVRLGAIFYDDKRRTNDDRSPFPEQ